MLADVDAAHRHPDRSPSRNSPEEQLDVKKALQIVSEHYGKRKAIFRFLTVHWCQVAQHSLILPHLICSDTCSHEQICTDLQRCYRWYIP